MAPNLFVSIVLSTKLPECQNMSAARQSTDEFVFSMADFIFNVSTFGCPLPCAKTNYKTELKYMHKNSLSLVDGLYEDGNGVFLLYFFYATLTVEEKIETLIYDFGGLMAAAGGNLGLCLGLSCLSILFSMIGAISCVGKKMVLSIRKN